ncbi:MAG TPA: ROK family protein, partial [Aggregatilineales bacterium]|nr:ROK family protein [Aggregatilineales bacterium]
MRTIIGVDVGGTLLRAAAFDEDLHLLERVEQPTLAGRGSEVVLDRLYETIRQVLPESPEDLAGIGIVLPGPLDIHAGVLIAPPNLPLKNTPIVRLVEENVAKPVFMGNDADLAGLAEYMQGAGRGTKNMVYMTL